MFLLRTDKKERLKI